MQDSTQKLTVKYAYDGNSNVVTIDTDGQTKHMTYNAIDQKADAGFEYDTNGRLVTDDAGHRYAFDDRDRLLRIQTPSGTGSVFSYHPDELLAKHESANLMSSPYYDRQQHINAMRITDPKGQSSSTVSLFSDGERRIAGYSSADPPTYMLNQRGSTALILDGTQSVGLTYQAYGSPTSSSDADADADADAAATAKLSETATRQCCSSFLFRQEYHDRATGLVYLRARFYSPSQMAFVFMDSARTENRYAYCAGDPINLADPSGHSWAYWAGLGVGLVVGFGVSLVATPAVGLLIGEGTMALIAGTMVGGAVGNVAAGYAAAQVNREGYGGRDVERDVVVGVVG